MKVLFLPEVRQYFQELEDVLFEKEYFGFEEFAVQYVRELILDIEKTLPVRVGKNAPLISTDTGKACSTPCSERVNLPNGMLSSPNTKRTVK